MCKIVSVSYVYIAVNSLFVNTQESHPFLYPLRRRYTVLGPIKIPTSTETNKTPLDDRMSGSSVFLFIFLLLLSYADLLLFERKKVERQDLPRWFGSCMVADPEERSSRVQSHCRCHDFFWHERLPRLVVVLLAPVQISLNHSHTHTLSRIERTSPPSEVSSSVHWGRKYVYT